MPVTTRSKELIYDLRDNLLLAVQKKTYTETRKYHHGNSELRRRSGVTPKVTSQVLLTN
jgi:hypothetical protein